MKENFEKDKKCCDLETCTYFSKGIKTTNCTKFGDIALCPVLRIKGKYEIESPDIFTIRTVEDMINCPSHLLDQCFNTIKQIASERAARELETGNPQYFVLDYFTVVDDGTSNITLELS